MERGARYYETLVAALRNFAHELQHQQEVDRVLHSRPPAKPFESLGIRSDARAGSAGVRARDGSGGEALAASPPVPVRCHICTGTGLTPATSAPGLGSPLPHLRRDWAHPCHIIRPFRSLPRVHPCTARAAQPVWRARSQPTQRRAAPLPFPVLLCAARSTSRPSRCLTPPYVDRPRRRRRPRGCQCRRARTHPQGRRPRGRRPRAPCTCGTLEWRRGAPLAKRLG